jgi:hypothetical protein
VVHNVRLLRQARDASSNCLRRAADRAAAGKLQSGRPVQQLLLLLLHVFMHVILSGEAAAGSASTVDPVAKKLHAPDPALLLPQPLVLVAQLPVTVAGVPSAGDGAHAVCLVQGHCEATRPAAHPGGKLRR